MALALPPCLRSLARVRQPPRSSTQSSFLAPQTFSRFIFSGEATGQQRPSQQQHPGASGARLHPHPFTPPVRAAGRSMSSLAASHASATQPEPVSPAAPAGTQHADAAEPPAWMQKLKVNFCRVCGGQLALLRPDGGKEWRHVCGACGYVDYHNPKMVVGCIVEHEGKILLCRRAIEPCRGKWTVPAGFMELNESTAAGAARETMEEANAAVQVIAPYAHWDIPMIGQAYILFRARLAPPYTFSSGPESLEVALFEPDAIPFDQIAFSSVSVSLRLYLEDLRAGAFRLHHGVIDKRPGSLPNDPGSFALRDHMAFSVSDEQGSCEEEAAGRAEA